jgi:hypothetical protein
MKYVYKLENFRILSKVEELEVKKFSEGQNEREVKSDNEVTGSVKVVFSKQ